MKRVKLCLNCKKYNEKKLEKCAFCGFRLEPDVYEVEDHITTFIDIETKPIEVEHQTIPCIRCGHPVDTSVGVCSKCNKPISHKKPNQEERLKELVSIEPTINVKPPTTAILTGPFTVRLSLSDTIQYFGRDYQTLESYALISRKHFSYQYINRELILIDLSTNGTKINGIRLEKGKPYTIKHGDRISVASYDCVLTFYVD